MENPAAVLLRVDKAKAENNMVYENMPKKAMVYFNRALGAVLCLYLPCAAIPLLFCASEMRENSRHIILDNGTVIYEHEVVGFCGRERMARMFVTRPEATMADVTCAEPVCQGCMIRTCEVCLCFVPQPVYIKDDTKCCGNGGNISWLEDPDKFKKVFHDLQAVRLASQPTQMEMSR